MVIIKLKGGLGNQMFQYAIAAIIAKRFKTKVLLDKSFFSLTEKKPGLTPRKFELDIFNNKYNYATLNQIKKFNKNTLFNRFKKIFFLNYYKKIVENNLSYNSQYLSYKKPLYLEGYFQSYIYYIGIEDYINEIFTFDITILDQKSRDLLVECQLTNSVSIHVRRGDYVNDTQTNNFHVVCSIEYYLKAINYLKSKVVDISYFIFSDDINWAKQQFEYFLFPIHFVSHNINENDWKDMFLMSSCKHNIIANSSFSWWGAWLNRNPEKIVISPNQWYNDTLMNNSTIMLIPSKWIRI
jgi:hypothetical protein